MQYLSNSRRELSNSRSHNYMIKKVEKLTFENFDFLHLILFGPTFKKLTLENSFYL